MKKSYKEVKNLFPVSQAVIEPIFSKFEKDSKIFSVLSYSFVGTKQTLIV